MKHPIVKVTAAEYEAIKKGEGKDVACANSEYNQLQFCGTFAMYPHSHIPSGIGDVHDVTFRAEGKPDLMVPCSLSMQNGLYCIHANAAYRQI